MTFYQVLEQVVALLQRHGRVSYRALRRQFDLDDAYLEDLKAELIEIQRLAVDQDGTMLVRTPDPGAGMPLESAPGQGLLSPSTPPQTVQQPVTAADRPAQRMPLVERHPGAERRQLTVMFCDLIDSTALAVQLDPEDLREVLRLYQETCAGVIQRFDGYIAQYLGDGLLVYFGYPKAHEDEARRAVHAGLEIVEAIKALQARLERQWGVGLAVRLGIHTGLVVVGEIGEGTRQEQLALGEAPNIAARLQGLAEPNTVLISAATYQLVQGAFACQALSLQRFKGLSHPVAVYQVFPPGKEPSRLNVPNGRRTPLVGRESEVALLLERLAQVKDGMGQVVLLSGEAGIGKSRLVQTTQGYTAGTTPVRLECRGSSYHQNTALYPVIDLLQRVMQWQQDETSEARLQKLERLLTPYRLPLAEFVPLLAALLSVPLPPEQYAPLSLTPQLQKQKTFEALLTILFEMASRRTVLLIVEDLHWIDPSSLEFLGLLVDQAPTIRLFVLLTYRPPFRVPWNTRAHVAQLTLNRLSRQQVEQMVASIAGSRTLPTEVVQYVVTRTDGVPLFVEELTKTLLASSWLRECEGHYELTGFLPALAIPTTLHDSLMARIDRLVTAKGVAQLAATLGRQFPYTLLQAVSPLDEATLQRELGQLVESELLYQRGLPPYATYMFKHALIQEAAYQSLLRSTRQHYHQQIAQVLAAHFPEIAATQPELLALHYTEAGLPAAAIPYWQCAGERAAERSAHVEVISHLRRGLEVLKTLPETPERIQHELSFLLALGPPLRMLRGHTAPEVEQVYTRARELCRQVDDSEQLFDVLRHLRGFFLDRAELPTAREFAEQCFELAQRLDNPFFRYEVHYLLGSVLFYQGDLVTALSHLQQGIALYDTQQWRSMALHSSTDSGVMSLAHASWTLWMLGYPDQALTRSQEACSLAQQLSHAYSLGFALHFAGSLHQYRREMQRVHERAEASVALAREHGFVRWLAGGMARQGWVLAHQGAVQEGIEQIQQAIRTWRAMRGQLGLPVWLARLAEAYEKGAQAEAGLQVLSEALALVQQNGERYYEAELYRLKGEFLLQLVPHHSEAEHCFRQALDIARHQQAKSLELRAVMSLSQLWQRQGKRAEALQLLTEIYSWFTEGFDTADLQAAQALLDAWR